VATYACSGLLAGVAGLLAAADIGEADVASCGRSIELDAILAVAIGGTALAGGAPRLAGSLIGALFMRTLTVALLMHGVVTEHTLLVKGAAAVAVCSLQSPAMLAWRRARSGRP
jgi:simple sugar transport system permease protein